jgi:CheY-like chemotaxis protein
MSHELRTPLNAVIGYSDMLLDDLQDDEQRSDVTRIRTAGRHLLSLINDVLDMSKIEAGRMEVHLEPVSLPDLLREVTAAVLPTAQTNGSVVTVERPPQLAGVYTDARKLQQILLNLASNAVKFTQNGQVVIRAQEADGGLQFQVEDTGIGIAPEHLERLFQPFMQADDSTSRRFGGTGLGLALSRRLAELLGGQLQVDSTLGVGSTFTLDLPLQHPSKATPAPVIDQGDAPLVLCIDDDPNMLDLLGRLLRREGLRVAQATSGADALDLARRHPPAVITLDVMMPAMDGWTLLQHIREDPSLQDVPVVMVSMVDHDPGSELVLGASDYLVKPVEADTLVATLRRYLATGSGTVLVVDDDDDLRELLRRALAGEGWTVHSAPDSDVALQILSEVDPDLVVLDLMMPGMDGFAFVDHVRGQDRWRELPIVVLTAMDLSREQWQALAAHTSQIVPKGDQGLRQVISEVRAYARPRG